MSELRVVDTAVEPFDTVTLSPDRVEYDDGQLTAVYPSDADTETFRVALFEYGGEADAVDLPEDSAVLSVGEGVVVALVPETAYHGGGGA